MAQVVEGRFTAGMDEPFVVFIIGMWLPLHKDPAAVGRGRSGRCSTGAPHRLYCLIRSGGCPQGQIVPDRREGPSCS